MKRNNLTRRHFLGASLAAGVAPYFVPALALGAEDRPAANSRLTVGCIGMGGRMSAILKEFLACMMCMCGIRAMVGRAA